ncbi:MAG: F0F1 ATP synthase subunit gamma [Gammaproteobacteria bacterium]|nr:F0F1 ATP synthase subunit gamma [Gammaproteobacteria bacterium]
MANTKEIRTKIRSIQSTQKITRAMEMVAASKMRKTHESMRKAKPYARYILEVAMHIAKSHSEYRHPYLEKKGEVKQIGIMIVSSDKGLCGSLNVNVFKKVLGMIREWLQQGTHVKLCLLGKKANTFLGRKGFFKGVKGNLSVVSSLARLGDRPAVADLLGAVRVMLDAYEADELQRVYIASNTFVNTMSQHPRVEQLLPIPSLEDKKLSHHWDYIYEPAAAEILDALFVRFIESQVYRAVVENIASEQAARMVAMKSASDNAEGLIDECLLLYNKARQASITRELSEIVGGAVAI